MSASIRVFALVGPYRDEPGWFPSTSVAYLRGFMDRRMAVRALSVADGRLHMASAGMNALFDPDDDEAKAIRAAWLPWDALAPCFQMPVGQVLVNIVCAPARTPYGLGATALQALWTANMYNVAISCGVSADDRDELDALARYDLLVPPDDAACAAFLSVDLPAEVLTPHELALHIDQWLHDRATTRT